MNKKIKQPLNEELLSIGVCYKQAVDVVVELTPLVGAFFWAITCIVFMPVVWCVYWAYLKSPAKGEQE